MGVLLEVDYYNSFWLKSIKSETCSESRGIWPGIPTGATPPNYPVFPQDADIASGENWYVEESRIKGGYNNNFFNYGNRAYANLDEALQQQRQSTLIYSGPYNPTLSFNQTNVFSSGQQITKTLDPANGSIQKTFAEDTNLTIFQENKVSKALIDKDAIYSAEGGGTVTSTNLVIGQIVPYLGKYGIGENPESFANFGMRKYFVDPNNNTVMRLSRDGLTEVSNYGMKDYFRDELETFSTNTQSYSIEWETSTSIPSPNVPIREFEILESSLENIHPGMKIITTNGDTGAWIENIRYPYSPTSPPTIVVTASRDFLLTDTGSFLGNYKSKMLGVWDNYNRYYTLSLQKTPKYVDEEPLFRETVSFDENVNGWVSFFNYKPEVMSSIEGKFFSIDKSMLYKHYSLTNYVNHANFYGIQYKGNIIFLMNDQPSTKKVFQTINYEGDNGWQVDWALSSSQKFDNVEGDWIANSDSIGLIYSYNEGEYTDVNGYVKHAGFDRKENLYVSQLQTNGGQVPQQVIPTTDLTGIKGYFLTVSVSTDNTTNVGGEKELWSVGASITQSS
jgi:hypothetical protein